MVSLVRTQTEQYDIGSEHDTIGLKKRIASMARERGKNKSWDLARVLAQSAQSLDQSPASLCKTSSWGSSCWSARS